MNQSSVADRFTPIAIVGQGCVLPEAMDSASLWSLLLHGRSVVAPIPDCRWRVDRGRLRVTQAQLKAGAEGCLTNRGGWVQNFEKAFDPKGLAIDPALLARLDPLVSWLIYAGRAALEEAGLHPRAPVLARAGVVFGHLGYPTTGLAEYAEAVWCGRIGPEPLNRFNNGLPADLLCQGLGLGGGGFALDAACASSLYAVKLASDRLAAGEVDLMLAGGVSRIDPLVLHAGFTALGALSPTGQSRPFHAEADGLLPAEGAALLALKRLEDAQAAGDSVLAVILGIGLANDGRSGGLLVPSVAGQTAAMAACFDAARLEPGQISFVECHATGTLLGDATEIESTGMIYVGPTKLPIGSIKSNFGHLTTASGAAGLMKLVLALRHGVRPPTLHCDPLAERVAQSRFRPVRTAEDWPDAAPRIAAISNFGFGGANAHLILGEARAAPKPARCRPRSQPRIAIIGLGTLVADGADLGAFREHLHAGLPRGPAVAVEFRMDEIRFPPRDLERTLPQQLLVLRAALDAVRQVRNLPVATGVFIGAQTDAEACRLGLRLRLAELAAGQDPDLAIPHGASVAGVVGCMLNITANRINAQLDLHGPGFTVAAEELSGLRALELALSALAAGEVDAAMAGAVDLSVEPVHQAALDSVAPSTLRPGDGAVVLVLKREEDAIRDGERIMALLERGDGGDGALDWSSTAARIAVVFGKAHAASGLIELAAAVLALADGVLPPDGTHSAPRPWPAGQPRQIRFRRAAMGGQETIFQLTDTAWLATRHSASAVLDTVP